MRKYRTRDHAATISCALLALSFLSGGSGVEAAYTGSCSTEADVDALPPGHWCQVPNSHLIDVEKKPPQYPDYNATIQQSAQYNAVRGVVGVTSVMGAWSGGAYDTDQDRLIIWGGGHADYAGNEVYVFDVHALHWSRLTDPYVRTDPTGLIESSGEYPDASGNPDPHQPRSVHTYSYLQYVPAIQQFCSLGVGPTYQFAMPGASGTNVHCFNFLTNQWDLQPQRISTMPAAVTGAYSVVDPSTGHVWVHATIVNAGLYEWNPDPAINTWTRRSHPSDTFGSSTYYRTAALAPPTTADPQRRFLVAVGIGETGAGTESADLNAATPALKAVATTGNPGEKTCEAAQAPGFVYDPVSDQFVCWSGGATVYTLNPVTFAWTAIAPAGGNVITPAAASGTGTYGRFRYIPSKNVFIVVNSVNQNVYFYKLTATSGRVRGDLDGDGKVTLADVRAMIQMLLGQVPVNLSTADLNGDGRLSLADLRALFQLL